MLPTPEQRLAMRDRPEGFPVMRQRWSRLLFLHWPMEPAAIQATLPPGLHVDTFEGKAWAGVVPFYMDAIRPVYVPPMPWISWFLEMNVRTYVHDDAGNSGVWFYSLDCNQPVAVEVARRFFHLPYHHARMKARLEADIVHYRSERRGTGVPTDYVYQPDKREVRMAEPGTFEFFLVERYLLFSASSVGRIHTGRVYHTPYTFTDAECGTWSAEPLRQAGLPMPEVAPASMLYSPGVDVWVHPLRRHDVAGLRSFSATR